MSLNFTHARELLRKADFRSLFIEELGWDRYKAALDVQVQGNSIRLTAIAEKRGMVAYHCPTPAAQTIPDYAHRRKIEHQVAKSALEHLIVFTDPEMTMQIWQWVKREPGKPAACREHTYYYSHSGDALLQKLEGIAFNIEEEERITLTEVTSAARTAFDVERVTKRFYERFKQEHAAFLNFVKGITDTGDREWYASVMLNRLMFVYFIQRKGFLDGNPDYLRERLDQTRKEHGSDKFYSFYRYFLLRLFHEGLGGRERSPALEKLLGRIPYLNGGLFDIHELEQPDRYGKSIEISDTAFERVFDYFDQYQWHLDERPLRDDKEINPDVLGYIFEKYINQKQMGAYYTKEDITEYISKNTVIPFLFDAARPKCKIAFENSNGPTIWDLLRTDPDRYIYPAVRHGITWRYDPAHVRLGMALDHAPNLPSEIAAGLNPPTLHRAVGKRPSLTLELRNGWNKRAPSAFALPTETWREVVIRRKRHDELRAKLAAGQIRDINDLITLNVDIRQFAQDVIENCEGPELLRAFWNAIASITILDPTCGSGAFLFAALNILEPLYDACLERMETFLDDLERSGDTRRPEKFADFRKVLSDVEVHPNRRYFILKSIVLRNLYGVDIMEEAVEICKLRLFLKLAAQVEPDVGAKNVGIEPLPDIDFNIRSGNTLIGYANYEAVKSAVGSKLDLEDAMSKIATKAADLEQTFDSFRKQQTEGDSHVSTQNKGELRRRLKSLEDELNRNLAAEFGVKPGDKAAYAKWLKSYEPFHWFIEFHGIMRTGGFDVILGNPPYILNASDKVPYSIKPDQFVTYNCRDLYAFVFERSLNLAHKNSSISLIVQLTVLSSEKIVPLQNLLMERGLFVAVSFPRRPESIFDGVEMPVSILVSRPGPKKMYTSRVSQFYTGERPAALAVLALTDHDLRLHGHRIGKLGTNLEVDLYRTLDNLNQHLEANTASSSAHLMYYQEACRYWAKACSGYPYFRRNGKSVAPPHGRTIKFVSKNACSFAVCLMNSSLFYWFYSGFSDCEHVNDALIRSLKIPRSWENDDWTVMEKGLARTLDQHSQRKMIKTKQGHKIEYDELNASQSKSVIDNIEFAIARHYGFTEEELDFVINYDIKYRTGSNSEAEEDE